MFSMEMINLVGLLAYRFCAKTDKRVLSVDLGGQKEPKYPRVC